MQVAGISVDPLQNNAAMVEKLLLPFPLMSDPRGALTKRYGLWDAKEGVAVPTIAAIDRSGVVRYLYSGEDFADRPGDEELFEALEGLDAAGEYGGGEPEIRVSSEEAHDSVRPDKPPMALEELQPYYRGVFFATVTMKRRFGALGREGRSPLKEVSNYQGMVRQYREAIAQTTELKRAKQPAGR